MWCWCGKTPPCNVYPAHHETPASQLRQLAVDSIAVPIFVDKLVELTNIVSEAKIQITLPIVSRVTLSSWQCLIQRDVVTFTWNWLSFQDLNLERVANNQDSTKTDSSTPHTSISYWLPIGPSLVEGQSWKWLTFAIIAKRSDHWQKQMVLYNKDRKERKR